ncbi:hypothetical protein [Sphingobium sp. SCG-1]|uniref:hypothetical protein n=1 Tax=Sphingobium sp. SCG-1 TaxID=2072936 RepID=UPI0011AB5155|nr:hypothetical protein [Sphingobium sp. SCG-1]
MTIAPPAPLPQVYHRHRLTPQDKTSARVQSSAEGFSPAQFAWMRIPPPMPARLDWGKVTILLLMLPLFGQSFHYIKDLPPLWALSKAFPLVALPLAPVLLYRPYSPFSRQLGFTFLWLVLISSFAAVPAFGQSFFMGLTGQIKLLPILSFFSFLGLLYWQKPTLRELTAAFVICGVATLVVLLAVWLLAPQSWYVGTIEVGDAPLLSADARGNRIRMPMFFAVLAMFYWYRIANQKRQMKYMVLVALVLACLMGLVRTRALVLGSVATLAAAMLVATTPRRRMIVLILVPILLIAMFQIPYVASVFDTDQNSGLQVRVITAQKATAFLGEDWINWLFGVGSISSIDPKGMAHFFSHYFFLADITWLGIIFEFGLVGAALLLAMPARGMYFLRKLRNRIDHPLLAAMQDYLLYVILISGLYPSLTLQPGEVAVILATAVYCRWAVKDFRARKRPFA